LFASQINACNEPEIPNDVKYKTNARISSVTISEQIIYSIMSELSADKATSPDGVGNLVLKNCATSLRVPISIIANKSIVSGVFPTKWKSANVVRVYKKKGDKQLPSSYRPISLLSSMSKVIERAVYNELYDHCIKNNLLSEKNSGFKKGDGALNQLLHITDNIYSGFNAEKETAIVFLDIFSAFNRVWHEGLKYKLKCFGIEGPLYDWLCSYLSNRSQKVVLNGSESSYQFTDAGVAQGSILGPLCFLIFINDFEENLKSDVYLFADDSTISKTYDNAILAEQCLNNDLISIEKWARQWMVDFNVSKTTFVNFSIKKSNKSELKLFFQDKSVVEVTEHKHLGIILTSDLKRASGMKLLFQQ